MISTIKSDDIAKPSRQPTVVTRMKGVLSLPHTVHGLVRSFSYKSSLPELGHSSSISLSSSGDSLSTTATNASLLAQEWTEPVLKGVLKKSMKSEPDLRRSNLPHKASRLFHQKAHVQFRKSPSIHQTYSKSQYDRQTDQSAVCLHLTVDVAGAIKDELNTYKMTEMQVHEESRIYTHYIA